MRTFITFHFLPKPSRQLTAVLLIPLMLNALLLNLAPTSRADEFDDSTTLPLEMIDFDAFTDPVGEGVEFAGQIQADDPGGLTVTITGAVNGTTETDAGGYFNYIVYGTITGQVTATVTQGAETDARTIGV